MKLQFDVAGHDLVSVRAYSYTYFLDSNPVGSPLVGVTTEQNGDFFTCTVEMPPESVGKHTLEVSVKDSNGESVKSNSFSFEVDQVLPAPANLRILGLLVPPAPVLVVVPTTVVNQPTTGTMPSPFPPATSLN